MVVTVFFCTVRYMKVYHIGKDESCCAWMFLFTMHVWALVGLNEHEAIAKGLRFGVKEGKLKGFDSGKETSDSCYCTCIFLFTMHVGVLVCFSEHETIVKDWGLRGRKERKKERERERDRQTETETETETETDRQTDRQTDREIGSCYCTCMLFTMSEL